MRNVAVHLMLVGVCCSASNAFAQNPPPSGGTPPDDTPSISVGTMIFPDFTYTIDPVSTDTDGSTFHFSQFNVTRAFLDVNGKIAHRVAFRATADVARESSTFSNIAGSLEFRVRYAYLQLNLDDWMTQGSWVRLGIHQTPWLEFAEGIYRYRFQGTMFAEREGYSSPSDAGASFHYELPSNYGEVHVGVYNGEGFNKAEVNGEKSLQVRGTIRPFASTPSALHGVRASVFYDADHYANNAPRNRFIGGVSFEHTYLNAAFEFLDTADRASTRQPEVDGRGYSIWATPKSTSGLEGLVRYDHLTPNTAVGRQVRNRTIVGVAYWFPHQGTVASALLLDYDGQTIQNFTPAQPKQSKVAVHGLISF